MINNQDPEAMGKFRMVKEGQTHPHGEGALDTFCFRKRRCMCILFTGNECLDTAPQYCSPVKPKRGCGLQTKTAPDRALQDRRERHFRRHSTIYLYDMIFSRSQTTKA